MIVRQVLKLISPLSFYFLLMCQLEVFNHTEVPTIPNNAILDTRIYQGPKSSPKLKASHWV